MEIERTTFGTITIDGKTYEHDVIIRLSGEVARRKKQLSKKCYGTSHVLSKDEAGVSFCSSKICRTSSDKIRFCSGDKTEYTSLICSTVGMRA
jgi:hypothetical protein